MKIVLLIGGQERPPLSPTYLTPLYRVFPGGAAQYQYAARPDGSERQDS